MSTVSAKPQNMPWMLPYLAVSDVENAVSFYQKAFGFELIEEPMKGDDGQWLHAELKYKEAVIMVGHVSGFEGDMQTPAMSKTQPPMCLYIYFEHVDSQYETALAAGATSLSEPEDMFWGDRMGRVVCPDGYHWSLGTTIAK